MTVHYVDFLREGAVRVVISDPNVVARCVENQDDDGVPQADVRGGTGWRNLYYGDLGTESKVIEHLAYNCAANGVERVNRLDGWADLADDAATMHIENETWEVL